MNDSHNDRIDALDFDWDIDYPECDTFQDLSDAVKLHWHCKKEANFSPQTEVELFEVLGGGQSMEPREE